MRNRFLLLSILFVVFVLPLKVNANYTLNYGDEITLNNWPKARILTCGDGLTCSANSNAGTVTIKVTANKCSSATFSFEYENLVTKQKGTRSDTVNYKESWKGPVSKGYGPYSSPKPYVTNARNVDVAYEGNIPCDNPKMYCYQKVYTRCGGSPDEPNTPTSAKHCYGNKPTGDASTDFSILAEPGDSTHRFVVDDSYCTTKPVEKEIDKCENNKILEGSSSKAAEVCSGETKMEIEDTICDPENDYYVIESHGKFISDFDMARRFTSGTLTLKSGVSFPFDIKVTSTKTITGKFDSSKWSGDYSDAKEKWDKAKKDLPLAERALSNAESILANAQSYFNKLEYKTNCNPHEDENGNTVYDECDNSEYEEARDDVDTAQENVDYQSLRVKNDKATISSMENLMDSLASIVTYYNENYVFATYADENAPEVTLRFDYKTKGSTKTKSVNPFELNDDKSSDGSIYTGDDARQKVLNNYVTYDNERLTTYNFKYSSDKEESEGRGAERIQYMMPNEETLDYKNGELASSSTQKSVDGWNRVYTNDRDVDPGLYDIEILVEKLGNNKLSKFINEKCKVSYYKTQLSYRIVEVTNPFVNSSYAVATNWRGKYDFTEVIKNGGGSGYTFDLPSSSISTIKNSNTSDKYLGTCYLSSGMYDGGSRIICPIAGNSTLG